MRMWRLRLSAGSVVGGEAALSEETTGGGVVFDVKRVAGGFSSGACGAVGGCVGRGRGEGFYR